MVAGMTLPSHPIVGGRARSSTRRGTRNSSSNNTKR
jgi:hypothetical protein